jgi:hypothetical protein
VPGITVGRGTQNRNTGAWVSVNEGWTDGWLDGMGDRVMAWGISGASDPNKDMTELKDGG